LTDRARLRLALLSTAMHALAAARACRVCGCTDADCRGCIAKTGAPCHWVGPRLCSACVAVAFR
jgi:hypothetical protein